MNTRHFAGALALFGLLAGSGAGQDLETFRPVADQGAAERAKLVQDDPPAIHLNSDRMERFREAMRPFYYDPDRYDTYLEQLGIEYPTVREPEPDGSDREN